MKYLRRLYFVQNGIVPGGEVKDHTRFDQNSEKVLSQDDITRTSCYRTIYDFCDSVVSATAVVRRLKCEHDILFNVVVFQMEKQRVSKESPVVG